MCVYLSVRARVCARARACVRMHACVRVRARLIRSVVETCNMAPAQLQRERHGRCPQLYFASLNAPAVRGVDCGLSCGCKHTRRGNCGASERKSRSLDCCTPLHYYHGGLMAPHSLLYCTSTSRGCRPQRSLPPYSCTLGVRDDSVGKGREVGGM